ncbi:hypothetical protein AMTRI_Chr03g46530 [Amborella trichopoda]
MTAFSQHVRNTTSADFVSTSVMLSQQRHRNKSSTSPPVSQTRGRPQSYRQLATHASRSTNTVFLGSDPPSQFSQRQAIAKDFLKRSLFYIVFEKNSNSCNEPCDVKSKSKPHGEANH